MMTINFIVTSQCHFSLFQQDFIVFNWLSIECVGSLSHKLGLVVRLDDTMRQRKLDLGVLKKKAEGNKNKNI